MRHPIPSGGGIDFALPLLTRLVVGYGFVLAGRGKWMNFAHTIAWFGQLGIPFPLFNAAFVATLEVACGLCLIVGLGTRLAAALLGVVMLAAMATADRELLLNAPGGDFTTVMSFVFLLLLLWLMRSGAGLVSLDTLLAGAYELKWRGIDRCGSGSFFFR